MNNVATKKIAGNVDYAGVADRLKRFREDNPRASITTVPQALENGSFIFTATILKDKAEKDSAEATGTAMYSAKEMEKQKAFEKLETIAVGRALSLLGYLNNGEIASSEEMEEFEDFKNDKRFEAIEGAITQIEAAESIQALKTLFFSLGELKTDEAVIEAKDKRKAELDENN